MLWFLLYLGVVGVHGQAGGMGEVQFVLNFLGNPFSCDGSTDWCDPSGMEAIRYNESVVSLTGMCHLKQGLEPCTMLSIVVNKEANGKSETVVTHEVCDVCNEIGNPESNYYKYLKYLGFPDKCPCEPGKYPIHDLQVESNDLPINSANAGEYKIYLNFYKLDGDCNCKGEKTYLACLQLNACIEPL